MMPNDTGMQRPEQQSLEAQSHDPLAKEAAAERSSAPGAGEEDGEYEEVEDLIYERTGTLCFPYPPRLVESGAGAADVAGGGTAAAGTRPEAAEAPSSRSRLRAGPSLGELVRGLRAVSASTPGVSLLPTVDVMGARPSSDDVGRARPSSDAVTRERPSSIAPPRVPERPLAGVEPETPCSASSPASASRAWPVLPEKVALGPAGVPARRSPAPAPRAAVHVAEAFTSASYPASRTVGSSRAREARSPAAHRDAQRITRPSLRAQQRALRAYPSFRQRLLVELRRLPLAQRGAALAVVAALVAASGFGASRAIVLGQVPRESEGTASDGAAANERTSVRELAPEKGRAGERAPALAHARPRVSVFVAEEEPAEPGLERRATDAPPAAERAKRATARSTPRAATPQPRREPCACLPGDPLCGCLD